MAVICIEDLERKLDQLLKEPDNPRLLNDIGVLLYYFDDIKNAEMYLQRANLLEPENTEHLLNYAFVLYRQFKWHAAKTAYEAYLKLDCNSKEVLERLADCYYLSGEYMLAAEVYERLNKLKKGDIRDNG